jgi:hypothetical protein
MLLAGGDDGSGEDGGEGVATTLSMLAETVALRVGTMGELRRRLVLLMDAASLVSSEAAEGVSGTRPALS